MNSAEKPKKVKLWKNTGGGLKKQKKRNFDGKNVDSTETVNTNSKKFKPKLAFNKNKKYIKKQTGLIPKEEKPESDADKPATDSAKSLKRKNEFGNSFPAKKLKPDGISAKQWKILHGNKKSTGQREINEVKKESEAKKKPEHKTKQEWKKAKMEKRGKSEQFDIGMKLKNLWEEFRREDCKADRKSQLLKQACDMLKGRVKEFTFAHDTVRVLECIIAEGSESQRTLLYEELKGEILPLTKSKYGKFFVLKMLKYGLKQQKDAIVNMFYGQVMQLIKHNEASEVLEVAFNECANATQRFNLIQEFFGPTYKFFKTTEIRSLTDLLKSDPEKKSIILENMQQELLKVLDKSVIKHSIVHHALWQYMANSEPSQKTEIIESLKELVPEILHTKDGTRVALHCVWFGTGKDRKVMIKAMKTFVCKIAMEEYGHMILLSLFDCCDDTKLIEKRIIGELKPKLLELSQNVHGKKVLIYLLNPRDPHYIHPDVVNFLKTGDNNEHSKKDPEIRHAELKAAIAEPLLKLIVANIQNLYRNNAFCLFALIIIQHAVGSREEAFHSIAELAVEPYTTQNKDTHIVEHPGSNFLLKQLIIRDKERSRAGQVTFSETLIKVIPQCVFKSWLECNRGAFLIVSMLETEIPSVVKRMKEELEGCKKYLSKKQYKGAEILLKKMKQ